MTDEYDTYEGRPTIHPNKPPEAYGRCPVCGAECKSHEVWDGGKDTCVNGHVYPSRDAVGAKK